jgi:hypothetical protein
MKDELLLILNSIYKITALDSVEIVYYKLYY